MIGNRNESPFRQMLQPLLIMNPITDINQRITQQGGREQLSFHMTVPLMRQINLVDTQYFQQDLTQHSSRPALEKREHFPQIINIYDTLFHLL
jgi:hypothetical protein